MGKKMIALMAAVLLSTSTLAMAASVADNMDTIAENYGKVLKADSTDVIKQGLAAMRVAALDAQKGIPTKLKSKAADSPEVKDFRHGLDLLIGQIDGALALADQGKLDEAKKAAQDFKPTRDTYHKKFR
ncbi:cytochrome b562 [Yersinia mollaretii]|uniref:Cytochrome n=1 Tax=Yersinia mollaretii TaxID=33060 RepID=A0AA36LU36_YERMO|nr:cytochrome b562 [Yersinia mollaretii]MDA5527481.1 cytochrome b562 [Yersinia mollaretii]MDA5535387.1 cytochrome b562 [Yersinia mollaretii]MDR7874258.1 cytochrome b562 [Yersinia mollaretii]NIL03733.1 cytochrome b562 [Yersinia mollaretii]PHZ32652.1 cytochrome B562 [Yersinia mollaretii]